MTKPIEEIKLTYFETCDFTFLLDQLGDISKEDCQEFYDAFIEDVKRNRRLNEFIENWIAELREKHYINDEEVNNIKHESYEMIKGKKKGDITINGQTRHFNG